MIGVSLAALVYELLRGSDKDAKPVLEAFPVKKTHMQQPELPLRQTES